MVFGVVWAFWGNINAWLRGESYKEYLDSKIEALRKGFSSSSSMLTSKKEPPLWMNWLALGMGVCFLLVLEVNSHDYYLLFVLGLIAIVINGIVLTIRLRAK
jgi:hypothetical protein